MMNTTSKNTGSKRLVMLGCDRFFEKKLDGGQYEKNMYFMKMSVTEQERSGLRALINHFYKNYTERYNEYRFLQEWISNGFVPLNIGMPATLDLYRRKMMAVLEGDNYVLLCDVLYDRSLDTYRRILDDMTAVKMTAEIRERCGHVTAEMEAEVPVRIKEEIKLIPIHVFNPPSEAGTKYCYLKMAVLDEMFKLTLPLYRQLYNHYLDRLQKNPLLLAESLDMLNRGYMLITSFCDGEVSSLTYGLDTIYYELFWPEALAVLKPILDAKGELKRAIDGEKNTRFEVFFSSYLAANEPLLVGPIEDPRPTPLGYKPSRPQESAIGGVVRVKMDKEHEALFVQAPELTDSAFSRAVQEVYGKVLFRSHRSLFELAMEMLGSNWLLADAVRVVNGTVHSVSYSVELSPNRYDYKSVCPEALVEDYYRQIPLSDAALEKVLLFGDPDKAAQFGFPKRLSGRLSVGTKVKVDIYKLTSVEPGSALEGYIRTGRTDDIFVISKIDRHSRPNNPYFLSGILKDTSFSEEELVEVQ